ncbi:hypothetical protein [Actinomadura sp. WMMA1423]|uniref:hypothetical protein n=1 Tax=Actinomadura sp. WMMA1423 TaxID=2591108 RepID=UPI0011478D34|nr:hypothetical protein [Actinomadura sp. WMMA1423]
MDRAAAAALAVAFTAWMGWVGYVHSEEWVKTAKRWRAGLTGDGYARWAAKHDGEAAEVLLSAVATVTRQTTRAARATQSFVRRRSVRPAPGLPAPSESTDPTGDAQPDTPPEPARQDPAPDPAPDPDEAGVPDPPDTGPTPEAPTRPTPGPAPDPAPLGEPMSLTNRPTNGEIVGLQAVLANWGRLVTAGTTHHAQAGQVTKSASNIAAASEALCSQINETLTLLSQLEHACYRHKLEPAALTRVHEAMEAAGAALNAQRRAHNELGAAATSLRTAAAAQGTAVQAYRAALDYLNRTHRIKAEVEAGTGARSDRDFGTT